MKLPMLAIIFPIAALLSWAGYYSYQYRNGQVVRIPIEAYDPRDLLSGHYMDFRLSSGGVPICDEKPVMHQNEGSKDCLCYAVPEHSKSELAPKASPSWAGKCDNRPASCSLFIQGQCSYGRFNTGINRYYIPEHYSFSLPVLPSGSNLEVTITKGGSAYSRRLFVGDLPIETYAAQNPKQR